MRPGSNCSTRLPSASTTDGATPCSASSAPSTMPTTQASVFLRTSSACVQSSRSRSARITGVPHGTPRTCMRCFSYRCTMSAAGIARLSRRRRVVTTLSPGCCANSQKARRCPRLENSIPWTTRPPSARSPLRPASSMSASSNCSCSGTSSPSLARRGLRRISTSPASIIWRQAKVCRPRKSSWPSASQSADHASQSAFTCESSLSFPLAARAMMPEPMMLLTRTDTALAACGLLRTRSRIRSRSSPPATAISLSADVPATRQPSVRRPLAAPS